ncbi:MAG TPA: hypothetical protein V6D20_24810 [Candidatus Obscuribacterales bacterium]
MGNADATPIESKLVLGFTLLNPAYEKDLSGNKAIASHPKF